MAKPSIYIIDNDPEILSNIDTSLSPFKEKFHVKPYPNPEDFLKDLNELKKAETALFLVDDGLPGMSGLDLIKRIQPHFPKAKKVLLTQFQKNQETIDGFKEGNLDCYIIKPVTPIEEKLLPVIADLLIAWQGAGCEQGEEIKLVGPKWFPPLYNIMNFLSRNLYPFKFYDIEKDPSGWQILKEHKINAPNQALVIFPDGSYMANPDIKEVAQKAGLNLNPDSLFYDLIIIGAGPSGLAASVYAASEGLSTLVIEKDAPGGQAGASANIANYLGFPGGISGEELSKRGIAQAEKFGVEILRASEVNEIKLKKGYKTVVVNNQLNISSYCILICTGVSYKTLNIPGLERLLGAGVFYGSVNLQAPLCKEQEVVIIGGGNSAGQAAMHLSHFARSVRMLAMEETLEKTMSQYLIEQIEGTENIMVCTNTILEEVKGDKQLEKAIIYDKVKNERKEISCSAVFVFIGAEPKTGWLPDAILRDENGFILTGTDVFEKQKNNQEGEQKRIPMLLETSVPGIYAAGDVRKGSAKRVASAVGEGAMAITFVHQYLD